jgi:hypothetical protein
VGYPAADPCSLLILLDGWIHTRYPDAGDAE